MRVDDIEVGGPGRGYGADSMASGTGWQARGCGRVVTGAGPGGSATQAGFRYNR